jgi:hypothetical protein
MPFIKSISKHYNVNKSGLGSDEINPLSSYTLAQIEVKSPEQKK